MQSPQGVVPPQPISQLAGYNQWKIRYNLTQYDVIKIPTNATDEDLKDMICSVCRLEKGTLFHLRSAKYGLVLPSVSMDAQENYDVEVPPYITIAAQKRLDAMKAEEGTWAGIKQFFSIPGVLGGSLIALGWLFHHVGMPIIDRIVYWIEPPKCPGV